MKTNASRKFNPRALAALITCLIQSVSHASSSTAYSPVFTVDTRVGGIAVSGRVLDFATRSAVSGATVTVGGQSATTSAAGTFTFGSVPLTGGVGLSVSRSGYASYTGTVPVPPGTSQVQAQDVLLQISDGTLPVVTGIRPRYDALFLSSVAVNNEYTATVDWKAHSPGSIEFYVNGAKRETVPTTGTEAAADINMGLGFAASLTPGANKVSAVAVSGSGARSAMFDQSVMVIPLPVSVIDQGIASAFLPFCPNTKPVLSWEFNFPRSLGSARQIRTIPFIGDFGADFSLDMAFDYELLSGKWGVFAGREWDKRLRGVPGRRPQAPKFRMKNVDFNFGVGLKAEGVASQTRGIVLEAAGLEISGELRAEVMTFYCTDYVPGGSLIRLLDVLKHTGIDPNSIQKVVLFGLVGADLDVMAEFQPPPVHFGSATITIKPGVEAVYRPNVWVAKGDITCGGNLGFEAELVPDLQLNKITGEVYLKIRFEAFGREQYNESFIILNGTIWSNDTGGADAPMLASATPLPALGEGWMVIKVVEPASSSSRYYPASGPEGFVAVEREERLAAPLGEAGLQSAADSLSAFRVIGSAPAKSSSSALETKRVSGPALADGLEQEDFAQANLNISTNVYGGASPAMASRGEELMLLYVGDNGSTNDLQFTDIRWTRWDGANWSEPATIHTNTQAEFAPQVGYDGNGDAIAVWERVANENLADTNETAMAANMEVVWAKWQRASGTWTTPAPLTANGYLDHAPLLCGPLADGSVIATWTANTANLLMGTGLAGSQVLWAKWSPSSQTWSDPQLLLSNLENRLSQSLSGLSNLAVYAWTSDADGVLTNAADQQVYCAEFTNGSWFAPVQITSDASGNRNVRALVSTNVAGPFPYFVWQKGTNLVLSADKGANISVVREGSDIAGFADYAATVGPVGNLAVLWQEMSQEGSDAHYAVYDPSSRTWSKDALLFENPPLERSFAPVWDNVGNLAVAYERQEIIKTNRTVQLEGGGTVTITNVPEFGRTDLCVTKRAVIKDLALLAGGFTAQGLNYLPGDPVELSASIRNLGNLGMTNVLVEFFDGDPVSGGLLITNFLLSGWNPGASTNTVTAIWIVPEPATNHVLFAVVNRAGAGAEFNSTNNSQSLSVAGADLQVSLLSQTPETNGSLHVVARVWNYGAPAATNSVLAIRRCDASGTNASEPVLAIVDVPLLQPGHAAQIAIDLPAGTQPQGEAFYQLRADETGVVPDVNTNNNTSSFAVNLWVDTDGDGMPDSFEAQHTFLSASDPADAQLDYDGDGASNLGEYLAGTDPSAPGSYLRMTGVGPDGSGGVAISWGSAPNKLYSIQRTSSLLLPFQTVAEHILSTPPENVYVDTSATNEFRFFWRVQVE